VPTSEGLGRALAQDDRAILIELRPPAGQLSDRAGFSDLVAGAAEFVDVIEREPGDRLHLVRYGSLDDAPPHADPDSFDVALEAFTQTYDWMLCLLSPAEPAMLRLLAPRFDAVVVASESDASDPRVVDLYLEAKQSGAPDVIVARAPLSRRMQAAE
jgi:hypothetical protein